MKKWFIMLCCGLCVSAFAQLDKGLSMESFIQDTQTRYNVRIYYASTLLINWYGEPMRMNQRMMDVDTLKGRLGVIECLMNAEVVEVEKSVYAIRSLEINDKKINQALVRLFSKMDTLDKQMDVLDQNITEVKLMKSNP